MSSDMAEELDYYARNKQERKEYQRKYYLLNKERIKAKRRVEEIADPEKYEERKAYNKSYYLENKEQILQKRAAEYARKRESHKTESKTIL